MGLLFAPQGNLSMSWITDSLPPPLLGKWDRLSMTSWQVSLGVAVVQERHLLSISGVGGWG